MILHYVSKELLRENWDFVKKGLEIVRTKGHMEWIVEDVYCDCFENRSMLFIAIENNQKAGFVVLQPMGNALHVWAAWSLFEDDTNLAGAWEEIKQIAKNGNKKRITFTSARKGWNRRAKHFGMTPSTWELIL